MRRRVACAAAVAALWGVGACNTGRSGVRSVSFTLERLQAAVAGRFPREWSAPGLLDVRLQAPRLGLLPDANRLSARLALQCRRAGRCWRSR